jgi:hypothetical protein
MANKLQQLPAGVKEPYMEFHLKYEEKMMETPGSVKHHHAWPGGYAVHIAEVMRNLLSLAHGMPVPESSGLNYTRLVTSAYIHDLDKLIYRYVPDSDPPSAAQVKYAKDLGIEVEASETKSSISVKIDAVKNKVPLDRQRISRHTYAPDFMAFDDGAIVRHICAEHGLQVDLEVLHAVCLHHGGFAPLAVAGVRKPMRPLAVLLHAADMLSAQMQNGMPCHEFLVLDDRDTPGVPET